MWLPSRYFFHLYSIKSLLIPFNDAMLILLYSKKPFFSSKLRKKNKKKIYQEQHLPVVDVYNANVRDITRIALFRV